MHSALIRTALGKRAADVVIKGGKLVTCGKMEEVKGNSSLEDVFLDLEDNND